METAGTTGYRKAVPRQGNRVLSRCLGTSMCRGVRWPTEW